jgi:hypothetical protein
MSQVRTGMTSDQVEALLGRPARIEQSETTGLTGELDHYPAPNGEGRVLFLNKTVFKADFLPGGKS